MSGWYVMHRGWMDSFKPEPFTERDAFVWSIEQAAFQEHDQWFNGHRITVARGEFVTSLRDMEKTFGWSLKRIRGFMDRMGKAQKWAQRRAYDGAQSPTIISVCNYETYQSVADDKGTVQGAAKGTRRAQSGHSKGTQQKEGNKGNNIEEDTPSESSISDRPAPEAQLLPDELPVANSLPTVDEVGPAFERYQACRASLVPGARPLSLSPDRRRGLAARLAEIGGATAWDEVLARIRGSPFLRGDTSRNGFVAEIDWLLKPINLRKVMEGNYDERPSATARRQSAPIGAVDAMREARDRLGLG
ncbi:hypothetical protein [Sphingomonas paucimobilis]|uniref:hypothetical protein n=1 Tax=Sphingomonas paucimobilis TaxID=13689 RepID=UPI00064BC97F|nr:hypothetical protein [Sphingomonas paucimobilis]